MMVTHAIQYTMMIQTSVLKKQDVPGMSLVLVAATAIFRGMFYRYPPMNWVAEEIAPDLKLSVLVEVILGYVTTALDLKDILEAVMSLIGSVLYNEVFVEMTRTLV